MNSVPIIVPRFPSLENSLNTVVVVRRMVYLKYTESARFMARATPLKMRKTHLHIKWYFLCSFLCHGNSISTIYSMFVYMIAEVSNISPPQKTSDV